MWTEYWFCKIYNDVESPNGLSPLERKHWCATQRQGNIWFWDLNFLCDYLSLNGLFYNSVNYHILLNKVLLTLTKKGFQWKLKTMSSHWNLIMYSYSLCLCCLLYLHCLSSFTQTSKKYTLMLWNELLWGKVWFNVRTSLVLWTTVLTSHEAK